MYYEIDPTTFAVRIFDGINAEPFWYQPNYPNGDSFDSVEEATIWAEEAMKSQDPNYGFMPPNGKGLEPVAKPTAQQVTESKLAMLGLTVEELKAALGLTAD